MRRTIITIVILSYAIISRAASVLIEAESFSNKGGWVVDQQFMDKMGSPYLLAHGMGIPVAPASTRIELPESGTYHVWVRTYNWTSPWTDGADGPGRFSLKIGGKTLNRELGTKGNSWEWQYAGTTKIKGGGTDLSLIDETGFDGRCDAIYLSTDASDMPPSDISDLTEWRRAVMGNPAEPREAGTFDLVVVGGGIAGMSAAVSAARLGNRVALINDRPILGGNNSSEVRVHLGGALDKGPYPELGGMQKEFGPERMGNAQPADYYEDNKKMLWIESEPNVSLFLNCHVNEVSVSDGKINYVIGQNIENGERMKFEAPLFVDCTGDGTVGYLAGADFHMGREGHDEFGEPTAPEQPDSLTMGASVQWRSRQSGKSRFPKFKHGIEFTDTTCYRLEMGEWRWETGMNRDQIEDAERVRDYGLMVVYSNWSYLKNDLGEFPDRELDWVAYIAGKRESRRLLGDYILKEDDIVKNVGHEDASFTTTWTIDLHFPDPENSERFPGNEFIATTNHRPIYPYAVPYRCLYSRNVDNLFMAGRNISVTHVALGTVRVMRTTGAMGEVVGMAADICRRHGVSPRDVYQHHLPELKAMMKKGVNKKGLPNNQKYNVGRSLPHPPEVK